MPRLAQNGLSGTWLPKKCGHRHWLMLAEAFGLPHPFSFDLAEADPQELTRVGLEPCPHRDFNGAGFLYFASFQSFLDQAEWQLFRGLGPDLVTVSCSLFYLGKINLGDNDGVGLCGMKQEGGRLPHCFEFRRDSDSVRIADGFTERRKTAGP